MTDKHARKTPAALAAALAALVLLASASVPEAADAPKPAAVPAVAPVPPAVVSPAAAEAAAPKSEEEFHYLPAGRRDPFKSLLVLQEKKKDVSMLPPIQQVDIQSFKVVGIIIDRVTGNRAMLQGPDGKSYVIKKGDIVGKNEGEVVSIDFNGLTVRERYLDFMNKETIVTTVLKVSEKPR